MDLGEVSTQGGGKDRPPQNFICLNCGKSFITIQGLQEHTNRKCKVGIKGYEIEMFLEPVSLPDLQTSSEIQTNPEGQVSAKKNSKIECPQCNKKLSTPGRHFSTHSGEEVKPCRNCGKRFFNLHSLYIHISVQCHQDGKSEIVAKNFQQPLVRNHDEKLEHVLKGYTCNTCAKSFRNTAALYQHKELQCGKNKLDCEFCSKPFKNNNALRDHLRIHTLNKTVSKTFKQPLVRIIHKNTEQAQKDLSCTVCGKSFQNTATLCEHQILQCGDKNLKCDFCTKFFTNSHALREHLRLHTHVKRVACNQCGRSLLRLSLKKHMEVVHKLFWKDVTHCDFLTKSAQEKINS